MDNHNLDEKDAEEFGDIRGKKLEQTSQIGLHNVMLIPQIRRFEKSRRFIEEMNKGEYDVFLATEIGLC